MFKDIHDYEGIYAINEEGQIKRIETGRELKPAISKNGYLVVSLWAGNIGKSHYVHRLLSEAFIQKERGKNVVNHKDGNKLNNSVSNLEWCTYSENNKHAYAKRLKVPSEHLKKVTGEWSRRINKGNSYRSIPVKQVDEFGIIEREFKSIKEAAEVLNVNRCSIYRYFESDRKYIKNAILIKEAM